METLSGRARSKYKYLPLVNNSTNIRVLNLLPGDKNDDLQLQFLLTTLPNSRPYKQDIRTSLEVTRKSLPNAWVVREALDGRLIFHNKETDETSWAHPDVNIDSTLWKPNCVQSEFEPDYDSLSYVWGLQDNSGVVEVLHNISSQTERSAGFIAISRNLRSALQFLRYSNRPRRLWVDALCINQEDLVEREAQVCRMRDVYSVAKQVVVWLGTEADESHLALSSLANLGSQIVASTDGYYTRRPDATEKDWFKWEKALPYTEEVWNSLCHLLRRPWFERLWVAQEIALSNNRATIQCGTDILPWPLFASAIHCLADKQELGHNDLKNLVLFVKRYTESYGDKTLSSMMRHYGIRKCLDGRDKIYGLLGIFPPNFARHIQPNYSPNVGIGDTYKAAFLTHINQVRRWELFGCEISSRVIRAPSWVPDWAGQSPIRHEPCAQLCAGHSQLHFTYSAPNKLNVTGLRCARVSNVSDALVRGENLRDDLQAVRSWQLVDLYERTYVTGESLLHAYASTLLLNRSRDRFPEVNQFPYIRDWILQIPPLVLFGDTQLPNNEFDMTTFMGEVIYTDLIGRRFMSTEEGYIGIVPSATIPGDIICVLLGCDQAVVLRPVADSSYEIVGNCFVYGLHDATALLGPLPRPWQRHVTRHPQNAWRDIHRFINLETGELTYDDPRLDDLEDWVRIPVAEALGRELLSDNPVLVSFFRNIRTGEIINSDPRLRPSDLLLRG